MSRRAEVLHDVFQERERQNIKWGGADHDDQHSMDEWRELIIGHTNRVPLTRANDRRLLIEVAALAGAAVESLDRKSLWEMPALCSEVTALEGDPWPAEVELGHAIARYIEEHGALVKPDVVEWLSSQCMRRMYKQCTTARCLFRGGYKNNPPFSPDIATCEPHEILNAIGITSE